MLLIRDVYPGSDFSPSRIPDPNCFHPRSRIRIKELKYFNPKIWFLSSRKYDSGCSSRIPDPDPDFLLIPDPRSRIQDPGVKKAPDPGVKKALYPGSRSATLVYRMENKLFYFIYLFILFDVCVSVKNMGTAKGYMFRVFAHSATSFTSSDEYKYPMPEDIKNRAITAGLVGR